MKSIIHWLIAANCVLICHLAASFSASAQQAHQANSQSAKMTPEQRVDMRLSKMKQNLNLSDEQVSKVKQLLLQEQNKLKANKGNKEAMKAEHAYLMEELAKILTPEQMTKFKQTRSQQGKQMQKTQEENK